MKLIRTLIENKRADGRISQLRPSQIAAKPRSENSVPVSQTLRARSVRSDQLDPRLKEFKIDLAELTPKPKLNPTANKRKRVWDLEAEQSAAENPKTDGTAHDAADCVAEEDLQTQPLDEPKTPQETRKTSGRRPDRTASALRMFEVPGPMQPPRALTVGRKKTRIMGFGGDDSTSDLFDIGEDEADAELEFPVGWLVITKGPGRGKCFVLQNPVSSIGRAADQTITLNFGDDTISRNNHAAIAYDDQMNTCFLGYGGKANLVRLNGRPVLTTEQLSHGDVIRVGLTDLRFIALCGPDFSWQETEDKTDE